MLVINLLIIGSVSSPNNTKSLAEYQQATLTTVVFLGMLLSSSIWGILADKYGRRAVLVVSIAFLFYFGVLSAAAPSFGWMLFLRYLVGFYIGGVPQAGPHWTVARVS